MHAMSPRPPLPRAVRACLLLIGGLAAACWLALLLPGHDPHQPDWNALSSPPSLASGHWFGTDAIGRDILARTLAGGRLSLTVGALATVMALAIGLAYGAIAGYAGGRVERAMVRVLDLMSALPFLLIVILLLALFGRSLWLLLAAIGGYVWIDLARVVRAEAARLAGARFDQVLRWHLLPNLMPLALVYLGLILPQAILVESFLGFLGLGVDEPAASWGSLLHEGSQELDIAPWSLLFPAGFLVATLASFQFLGDGLRDWLDVRGDSA
jgi:oligopeptide transport system permease protein